MAVVTSSDYKNTLYLPDSIQILTIFFDNAEVDSNLIQKVKLKDTLFDGTTFSLGSTAITELELVFDESITIPSTIQLYYSLQTNEQEEVGAFNVGFFDVVSYDNSSKGCIKVQAQDYMNRFNKPIDISNIVPCTRLEVVQYICNQCNVPLGVNTFLNANITMDVYDDTTTAQKYIAYIAERAGGFARINRNGQLEILSYNDVDTISLPEAYIGEFTNGDKFIVSKVIYENGVQKYEYGDNSGSILKLSQNNILSCIDEEVSNIYFALNGMIIESAEIRMFGDPSIDVGDIIGYGTFQTFCQRDWDFNLGFTGKYKTNINKLDESSNMTKSGLTRAVKTINANIDEINGTITTQARLIQNNIEQISRTQQDVTNITNLFQITGGTNLIKNSQFLFKDYVWDITNLTQNNSYHTELGEGYDSSLLGSTIASAKIKLKNCKIKSTIENVATGSLNNITGLKLGQLYTLNFYYSQDDETTSYIRLYSSNNDSIVEIDETFNEEMNMQQMVFTFTARDMNYYLEFQTTTNLSDGGYFTIYDLMLNSGDVKPWEASSNESYSTNIKLSQRGLSVNSSGSGFMTEITSDEFAVKESNNGNVGETITTFNKEGMDTKKASMDEVNIKYNNNSSYVMKEMTINSRWHHVEYFGGE